MILSSIALFNGVKHYVLVGQFYITQYNMTFPVLFLYELFFQSDLWEILYTLLYMFHSVVKFQFSISSPTFDSF